MAQEAFLTEKHVRAWQYALDGEADFEFVYEDDLRVSDWALLANAVGAILSASSEECLAWFLSVPLSVRGSGVQFHQDVDVPFACNVTPPVCNSTAAYVLSRPLAEALLVQVFDKPLLRLLPPDLMMNELFRLVALDKELVVRHCEPELIRNTSLTGETESLLGHG